MKATSVSVETVCTCGDTHEFVLSWDEVNVYVTEACENCGQPLTILVGVEITSG